MLEALYSVVFNMHEFGSKLKLENKEDETQTNERTNELLYMFPMLLDLFGLFGDVPVLAW